MALAFVAVAAVILILCYYAFWKRAPHIATVKDRHIFITGASSGIGYSIAKTFLAEGAYVTITGRNSEALKTAATSLSNAVANSLHRIQVKVADASDYRAMSHVISESFAWKPIDVLICNAGLTRSGYLDHVSVEDIDLIVRTNILGVLYATHAALPLMKKRSPHHPMSIVVMGSLASLFLMYGNTAYTGTKYALKGITESLRLELLPYNIKVNLICPGFVKTPLLDEAEKASNLHTLMWEINLYDRRYALSPEDVASSTLEAVKDGSAIVTMTPVLGWALLVCARGFVPDDSILKTMEELITYPIVRLVSIPFKFMMHRSILACHRKEMEARSSVYT